MWYKANDSKEIGSRIKGLKAKDSIEQSKIDGGHGIVIHPVTNERVYWL
jgi:hypothetical protein